MLIRLTSHFIPTKSQFVRNKYSIITLALHCVCSRKSNKMWCCEIMQNFLFCDTQGGFLLLCLGRTLICTQYSTRQNCVCAESKKCLRRRCGSKWISSDGRVHQGLGQRARKCDKRPAPGGWISRADFAGAGEKLLGQSGHALAAASPV